MSGARASGLRGRVRQNLHARTEHLRADLFANGSASANVRFTVDDVREGEISFTVYDQICYIGGGFNKIKAGDTLSLPDGDVQVESVVERNPGVFDINGGVSANGLTLDGEEDGGYNLVDANGKFIQAAAFSAAAPFADQVKLRVYTSENGKEKTDETAVPASGVKAEVEKLAAQHGSEFGPEQTTVTCENGRVVEIIFDFIPHNN